MIAESAKEHFYCFNILGQVLCESWPDSLNLAIPY
jgi:hypothetical protein